MKDDIATLSQILERIERIEVSGVDRRRFLEHVWDQDAVIRNLEIIGEAAKRLSKSTRERSPGVRWSDIAGFRDMAIHAYDELSLERTWTVVAKDLPELKRAVRLLLTRLSERRRAPYSPLK